MEFYDILKLACELEKRSFYPYGILRSLRYFTEYYQRNNSTGFEEFVWRDIDDSPISINIKIEFDANNKIKYTLQ